MTAAEFNQKIIDLQPSLERFALSLTTNQEEAKDLVQETYLKAITYRDKFIHYTNLKAWLFTILKNTFINTYRKAVRENTAVDQTPDLYYLNQTKDRYVPTPDSNISQEEIIKKIDELEEEFRIPFVMHTSGFKYKEIADTLNLKIGTVKSRIFFTRKKLMEQLPEYAA
ncbi:MAG: RNA polymerase sigma factor [bacterium]